jgi:hypothetical protein
MKSVSAVDVVGRASEGFDRLIGLGSASRQERQDAKAAKQENTRELVGASRVLSGW